MPSDGRNGGLVMIWCEGVDVRFMSYLHSHIDVVVHGEGGASLWRAMGFYGHPDTSKRHFMGAVRDLEKLEHVVVGGVWRLQ